MTFLKMVPVVALMMFVGCKKKSDKKTGESPGPTTAAPSASAEPEKKPAAPAAIVSSCDHGMSVCTDYVDPAQAKELCRPGMDGTLSESPCPTAGLVGSCALPEGGSIRRYYSTGESPNDAAGAESHCKNAMGGTVTPAS